MTLSSTDRIILCWTIKHDYACRYLPGDSRPILEVELEEVTVRFDDGRLIALLPHDDMAGADRIVLELARVFALCGYVEMNREETAPPAGRTAGSQVHHRMSGGNGGIPARRYAAAISAYPN